MRINLNRMTPHLLAIEISPGCPAMITTTHKSFNRHMTALIPRAIITTPLQRASISPTCTRTTSSFINWLRFDSNSGATTVAQSYEVTVADHHADGTNSTAT